MLEGGRFSPSLNSMDICGGDFTDDNLNYLTDQNTANWLVVVVVGPDVVDQTKSWEDFPVSASVGWWF